MNTSAPKLPGYFSSIRKMKEEHGVARGGGNDFIILALKASTEENFYQGLPIVITKGPGVGETGIALLTGSAAKLICRMWRPR